MDWIKIKDVLSPEVIRDILSKEVFMIKYYVKPRRNACYTTILFEFLNKQKEIQPYVIEIHEKVLDDPNQEHVIAIDHKAIRYKDSYNLTASECDKLRAVFKLLGFRVVRK